MQGSWGCPCCCARHRARVDARDGQGEDDWQDRRTDGRPTRDPETTALKADTSGAGATGTLRSSGGGREDDKLKALGMTPKTWRMVNLSLWAGVDAAPRDPADFVASSVPLGPVEDWVGLPPPARPGATKDLIVCHQYASRGSLTPSTYLICEVPMVMPAAVQNAASTVCEMKFTTLPTRSIPKRMETAATSSAISVAPAMRA